MEIFFFIFTSGLSLLDIHVYCIFEKQAIFLWDTFYNYQHNHGYSPLSNQNGWKQFSIFSNGHSKARAKHSPFAKNPDLAIIGERISGLTKILAKDFQLLGENKQ